MQPNVKIRKLRAEGPRRDGNRTPQAKQRAQERRRQRRLKVGR